MSASRLVVELDFDPILRVDGFAVRLETVALAITILAVLVLAGLIARVTPSNPATDPQATLGPGDHLRRDDLLFVVLGVIPGAVIGGRVGYGLVHLDYFGGNPGALLDPAIGSMQLTGAVLGGLLSGWLIASLLETPAGRWLHVATLPVLLGLGAGKLLQVLGGDGQGSPSTLPWATAFTGDGPWGSLAPAVPSHPTQVYEAVATAAIAILLLVLLATRRFPRRDGRAFFLALALWAVARLILGVTSRDAEVLGPLRVDQLLSLAVLCVAIAGFVVAPRLLRGFAENQERRGREVAVQWPNTSERGSLQLGRSRGPTDPG